MTRTASMLALFVMCAVGCSLEYHYPDPSASDLVEFDALTVTDLDVDTGRIPEEPPSPPFVASIKHKHERYFVPTRINGRKAELMLDWGSWVTLGLMPYMVRAADATLSDSVMATSTLDGEGEMRTGVVDELVIAGTVFRSVPFAMSNKDLTVTLGAMTVYRGQGMLGLTLLAGYGRFAVDLKRNRLHFGTIPPELMSSPDLVTLPIRVNDGLWIDANVDGIEVPLKVDIGGYRGRVMLLGEAAEGFMRDHPSQFAGHSTGFGEAVFERRSGRAGVVRVSGYEIRDAGISLGSDGGGGGGLVGDRFFGETIVGVDWDKRELYFVPVGAEKNPRS